MLLGVPKASGIGGKAAPGISLNDGIPARAASISSARFYEPPNSVTAQHNSPLLPILTYTLLSLSFVMPKIKVPQTSFQLGSMRVAGSRRGVFDLHVESLCDVSVPLSLEGLPSWMGLAITDDAASSPSPSTSRSVAAILPPRGSVTIPLVVRAPPRAVVAAGTISGGSPVSCILDHSFNLTMLPERRSPRVSSDRDELAERADRALDRLLERAEKARTKGERRQGTEIRVVLSIDVGRPYQVTTGGRPLPADDVTPSNDAGADAWIGVEPAGSREDVADVLFEARRQRLDLRGSLIVPPPPPSPLPSPIASASSNLSTLESAGATEPAETTLSLRSHSMDRSDSLDATPEPNTPSGLLSSRVHLNNSYPGALLVRADRKSVV